MYHKQAFQGNDELSESRTDIILQSVYHKLSLNTKPSIDPLLSPKPFSVTAAAPVKHCTHGVYSDNAGRFAY